jgi:hypothetical protein
MKIHLLHCKKIEEVDGEEKRHEDDRREEEEQQH